MFLMMKLDSEMCVVVHPATSQEKSALKSRGRRCDVQPRSWWWGWQIIGPAHSDVCDWLLAHIRGQCRANIGTQGTGDRTKNVRQSNKNLQHSKPEHKSRSCPLKVLCGVFIEFCWIWDVLNRAFGFISLVFDTAAPCGGRWYYARWSDSVLLK